jgi:hypothetical protein
VFGSKLLLFVADLVAGTEQNTSLVPALKLTALPLLLEDMMVVLANVDPLVVYVPTPVSHSVADW